MEVESALRRMYLSDDTARGYVGEAVYRHRLEEKVDGTGGRAIVIQRNGGWATPDDVTTQEYPLVRVKFYADPTRDNGQITTLDAEDKALAMYRALDRLLHGRRGLRIGAFGSNPGLMVVTCRRNGEPMIVTEKDRHGPSAGDPLGDSVYAIVEYAMQVVH